MMVCHAYKDSAAFASKVSALSSLGRRGLVHVGLMAVQDLGYINL